MFAADPPPVRPEKVDFSHGETILPDKSLQDKLGREMDFLDRDSSVGGVLSDLPSGGTGSGAGVRYSPQMLELLGRRLDAQKNWAFAKPGDRTAELSFDQALEAWAQSGSTTARGSALEEFFRERDKPSKRSSSGEHGLQPLETSAGGTGIDYVPGMITTRSLDPVFDVGTMKVAGAGGRTGSGSAVGGDPAPVAAGSGMVTRDSGFSRMGTGLELLDRLRSESNIRTLIEGPRSAPSFFDAAEDVTRQELNPVTPRRGLDSSVARRRSSESDFGLPPEATAANRNAGASPLRELTEKVLGPAYGTTPQGTRPVEEATKPISRSSALQMPSRKF